MYAPAPSLSPTGGLQLCFRQGYLPRERPRSVSPIHSGTSRAVEGGVGGGSSVGSASGLWVNMPQPAAFGAIIQPGEAATSTSTTLVFPKLDNNVHNTRDASSGCRCSTQPKFLCFVPRYAQGLHAVRKARLALGATPCGNSNLWFCQACYHAWLQVYPLSRRGFGLDNPQGFYLFHKQYAPIIVYCCDWFLFVWNPFCENFQSSNAGLRRGAHK